MEQVVAAPKPSSTLHPPSTIGNDLPGTNTLVLERGGKLLGVCAQEPDHVCYLAGCGSGLMTGAGLPGVLLGGGGRTGSLVGPTGSSSGTTV
jgi:hypothetical protein